MRLSRYKLHPKLLDKLTKDFYKSVLDQDNYNGLVNFGDRIFTPTELEALGKRLGILKMLRQDLSYWEIKDKIKVTNSTINKMANILKKADKRFIETLGRLVEEDKSDRLKRKESKYIKSSKQVFAKRRS
ncbi:MAG: hypothetical protein A2Z11_03745 [Candidatus Woykebacteria bacterium RBG_16_43_9]|uniref:TrpR like protein, YerC/YecD n=1 Tax=Candidatus Woykebacteria bacterium RBG_16_43_9 TaxID=1802596 RepID=A0A1G1WCU7_9BACT|nr:MAG: hypothetical protein A2Z11_03745 [Candidatus Woykebacteria bacterium RBG_16_43_9]